MILGALEDFASEMKGKGYDRMFQTNGEYSGNLKESILKYMEQAIFGEEPGLKDGISLFTYLKWDSPDKDYINAWMKVGLVAGHLSITTMSLTYGNRYGTIKNLDLDLKGKPIPTRAEAIAAINPVQHKKKRKGFRL